MALTCYVPHLQSDRCARSKVTNNYAAFLVVVSDEDYDESQKYIQEKIIVTLPYLASSHKPQGKTSANSETSGWHPVVSKGKWTLPAHQPTKSHQYPSARDL